MASPQEVENPGRREFLRRALTVGKYGGITLVVASSLDAVIITPILAKSERDAAADTAATITTEENLAFSSASQVILKTHDVFDQQALNGQPFQSSNRAEYFKALVISRAVIAKEVARAKAESAVINNARVRTFWDSAGVAVGLGLSFLSRFKLNQLVKTPSGETSVPSIPPSLENS